MRGRQVTDAQQAFENPALTPVIGLPDRLRIDDGRNWPRNRRLIRDYVTAPLTVDYKCSGLPSRAVRAIEAVRRTLGKRK
jgi:hypothetical protein